MPLFKRDDQGLYWELVRYPGKTAAWYDSDSEGEISFKPNDLVTNKIYEASNSADIRKLSGTLLETLDQGWIDREGNFWGCDFADHDRLLGIFFNGIDCGDAERLGWIHLHDNEWKHFERGISTEQEETLINIGRSAEDKYYRDCSVKFTDAFPEGYPLALLPCNKYSLHRPGKDKVFQPSNLYPAP